MKNVREEVAKNIRYFREKANLTQKELADKIGIAATAISNYEKLVSSPNVGRLAEICNALNVRPTVMMGITQEHESKEQDAVNLKRLYDAAPEHIRKTVDTLLEQKAPSTDR